MVDTPYTLRQTDQKSSETYCRGAGHTLNIMPKSNGGWPSLPRTLRRRAAIDGPRKTLKSTTPTNRSSGSTRYAQRVVPIRRSKIRALPPSLPSLICKHSESGQPTKHQSFCKPSSSVLRRLWLDGLWSQISTEEHIGVGPSRLGVNWSYILVLKGG